MRPRNGCSLCAGSLRVLRLASGRLFLPVTQRRPCARERVVRCPLCHGRARGPRASAIVARVRTPLRPWWEERLGDRHDRVCYVTKGEALRAFVAANLDTVEAWGGLQATASGGEFDAINERAGLRGSRRVRTLAGVLWVALTGPAPYRLDRIALEDLNETSPGRDYPFRLPDAVVEHRLLERAIEIESLRADTESCNAS